MMPAHYLLLTRNKVSSHIQPFFILAENEWLLWWRWKSGDKSSSWFLLEAHCSKRPRDNIDQLLSEPQDGPIEINQELYRKFEIQSGLYSMHEEKIVSNFGSLIIQIFKYVKIKKKVRWFYFEYLLKNGIFLLQDGWYEYKKAYKLVEVYGKENHLCARRISVPNKIQKVKAKCIYFLLLIKYKNYWSYEY